MVSNEEENFLRIVYLNYRVATGALTRFFDKLHPHLSADLHLPGNKSILLKLYNPPPRRKRVLYTGQWNILYPPSGSPAVTSADLDMTLIVCLLRNLPPVVVAPANGFDLLPNSTEISDGADIARLKYYKNFLVSHSEDGTLSNVDYVGIWNTLEQAIKGLGNSQLSAARLKDAKTKILDTSMAQMLSTQIQLSTKVARLQDELEQMIENIEEKRKITESNFEKEIKVSNENIHILYERLNTEEVQMVERNLKEFQNCQQLLASKFTCMETIVKQSEQKKEAFNKDVSSFCSQIQDFVGKHKEKICALEHTSNSFDKTLHELQKDVDSIRATTECIKAEFKTKDEDHIPKNIRAQHGQMIKEWVEDETTFVETRATLHILGSLPLNNCIIVTGSSGCGKSSNIHHAALHLRDSFGYEIIPVLTGPTDIINYYDESKKQVFVVDDICGKETINRHTLQAWRDTSNYMVKIFKIAENNVANKNESTVLNVSGQKILITCRLHIFKDSQFKCFTFLTQNECNLLSTEFCLLQSERMVMLHKYLPKDIIDNVKQLIDNVDFFPLLCKMSKDKTSEEVKKLFTAPLNSIKDNISHIINENKNQFCALALCILFDGRFDTNWLTLRSSSELKDKIEDIVNEFDLNLSKEMHRHSLNSGFSTLNGTYLTMRGTEYRMIHDKIYKIAALICGQILTECFIKNASSVFIRDHFIFDSSKIHEKDVSIVLFDYQEKVYFDRLLYDLIAFDITSTFHNTQLVYKSFTEKLISFFERSDDAKLVLKNIDKEGGKVKKDHTVHRYFEHLINTTPLIEAASGGNFDIVKFLILNVRCNVNKTDRVNRSSLHKASQRGHSAIVKLLLENNADVSQCNTFEESPLYVACQKGHTRIVDMLLQNKADVMQCNLDGKSPLYVASAGGHTDTVKLLLQHNADVSQWNQFKLFPLHVASKGGHIDTVKLLLQNYADVSQCNLFGMSPLYVACEGGHIDMLKLLLQHNADVSQCSVDGKSPLYVASEAGHASIVQILLQNNADACKCNAFGESPLGIACKLGYTLISQLLLQNNADVCKYDHKLKSPLYNACAYGDTFTVKLLLDNNADVSKCSLSGQSPLYVACRGGHTDIVKLLLQKYADVSHCDNDGKSPLYIACQENYSDIVELLLKKNADVSQCETKDGNSPLHTVCNTDTFIFSRDVKNSKYHNRNARKIETVKLLLTWNANAEMSNKTGQTPLDIARKCPLLEIINLLEEYLQLKASQLK